MADSYDELNKKFNVFLKDQEKDKKIIQALKDQVYNFLDLTKNYQVNTLKTMFSLSNDENNKVKDFRGDYENSTKSTVLSLS